MISTDLMEVPERCCVTGGSGFVGQRLVEILVERGAKYVVSFDRAPAPQGALQCSAIKYVQGDLTVKEDVFSACEGVDCVFHIAALVGPYFPDKAYEAVNYGGTVNVIEACKAHKVTKMVMSSSPSTRFWASNPEIDGKKDHELEFPPDNQFTAPYAKTKAMGEKVCRDACCDELMTVAVAPHQVYGPRDLLFMPNLLEAGKSGMLRIFGNGKNRIAFTHVDNYCHGLCLGARALYKGSPALGKFYICTDGDYQIFWDVISDACVSLGFQSLHDKYHLPESFMMGVGHVCDWLSWAIGKKLKLNAFAVKMLVIHRWFDIENARNDLGYEPLIPFEKGWAETIEWFRENWLTESGGGPLS